MYWNILCWKRIIDDQGRIQRGTIGYSTLVPTERWAGDSTDVYIQPLRCLKVQNDKDYAFHISAEYDFDKRIWRSWWFQIEGDWWRDSNITDHKYPILNDRFFFYNMEKLKDIYLREIWRNVIRHKYWI